MSGMQPGEGILFMDTPPQSALSTAPPLFSPPLISPSISLSVIVRERVHTQTHLCSAGHIKHVHVCAGNVCLSKSTCLSLTPVDIWISLPLLPTSLFIPSTVCSLRLPSSVCLPRDREQACCSSRRRDQQSNTVHCCPPSSWAYSSTPLNTITTHCNHRLYLTTSSHSAIRWGRGGECGKTEIYIKVARQRES